MFKVLKFGFDACLVSGFVAAVKNKHQVEPKTELISEPIIKKTVDVYLSVGEYLIDRAALEAKKHPEWFSINPKS